MLDKKTFRTLDELFNYRAGGDRSGYAEANPYPAIEYGQRLETEKKNNNVSNSHLR